MNNYKKSYIMVKGSDFMKKKHLFSRAMATLTDLVITLLPILVWDLIIFIILAGMLPATVMTFLDKVIKNVIIVSFCITNPFITALFGKTVGQMVYDIRIHDNRNKLASLIKRVLREFLGGIVILAGIYFFNGLPLLAYIVLNSIVILADKKARGLFDFICGTIPTYVNLEDDSDVIINDKKKETLKEKEVLVVPSKNKAAYHYDLHVHSRHSIKGMDTVEELFQKSKDLGIQVLSITDEYSVKGNIEAEVLSKPYNIDYIPGISMTCLYKGYELKVLGYGIDYKNHLFIQLENEHLKQQRSASKERIEKFKEETGIDLNFSKLVNQTNSGIVTAEMIVKEALTNPLYEDNEVLKKYRNIKNAYQMLYSDYFLKNKPCYVQIEYPNLIEVIESIQTTNGLAVLAYPKKLVGDDTELLKEIIRCGIDGIEVFSSYHNEEDIRRYLEVAKEMNCFVSAGSDYHGENGLMIEIGDCKASERYEKVIRVLIDRCLKMVEKKA